MQLGEEEAFNVLRHLNFNYGLRNQYMPDMGGLRVSKYYKNISFINAFPIFYGTFSFVSTNTSNCLVQPSDNKELVLKFM